jgi:hypothetical protein
MEKHGVVPRVEEVEIRLLEAILLETSSPVSTKFSTVFTEEQLCLPATVATFERI